MRTSYPFPFEALRAHKQLSKRRTALTIGVDQGFYVRLEQGEHRLTWDLANAIAEAAGHKIIIIAEEQSPLEIAGLRPDVVDLLRLIIAANTDLTEREVRGLRALVESLQQKPE